MLSLFQIRGNRGTERQQAACSRSYRARNRTHAAGQPFNHKNIPWGTCIAAPLGYMLPCSIGGGFKIRMPSGRSFSKPVTSTITPFAGSFSIVPNIRYLSSLSRTFVTDLRPITSHSVLKGRLPPPTGHDPTHHCPLITFQTSPFLLSPALPLTLGRCSLDSSTKFTH